MSRMGLSNTNNGPVFRVTPGAQSYSYLFLSTKSHKIYLSTHKYTHIFICTHINLLILPLDPKFSFGSTCLGTLAVFRLWLCASFSRKKFSSPHITFPSETYSFSSGSTSLPIRQCGSLLGCIWAQTRPFVELLYSYLPNYRIQRRMSELITCIYCLQGLGKHNATYSST